VGLTSPGRLIQGVVVLMLVSALPEVAREPSPAVRMNEYERTLDALERYRVLADEDDGAILPETVEPVEAGDRYEGVLRLISLLTRVGDLPAGASFDDPDLYAGAHVTKGYCFGDFFGKA
jgi:hypothetical protein